MKFVWILTKEIEYQWTTYHFIHGVYDSRELADKAIAERVKLYGGHEDDYVIIKELLIQEERCSESLDLKPENNIANHPEIDFEAGMIEEALGGIE